MQYLDDWTDLRVFAAVVREGSLVAGAAALGLNHSTVFRRIRRLEAQLSTRLLARNGRSYVPTEVGRDVFEIAAGIEDAVQTLGRRVKGADAELRGIVRFTTVAEILTLLRPHLLTFRERHPGITLEASIASRSVDLATGEADIAIRAGARPEDGDLAGRRIGTITFSVFASPEYLSQLPRPATADDLSAFEWVAFDEAHSDFATMPWLRARAPEARVVFRSSTIAGQLEGVLAGLGVAALPSFVHRTHPRLERLFDIDLHFELWLLWHRDLRHTARVRAFGTFIAERLEEELTALEREGLPGGSR